jgi:PAS domain S-box-containing protein
MSAENQKTILLVDDDMIIAMTVKMTLEKYGYKVMIANTAEEAIATVEKTSGIDLILMDINLGAGMDGTEAAAIILRDHDIPVVFLSSHTEPDIVAKTEKITSYGYVVKNSGDTVLQASIKMAFKLFEAKINEKEKELLLRKSEEKFKQLFTQMPSAVSIYDAVDDGKDFVFKDFNIAAEKIEGIKKDDLVGKRVTQVFPGVKDFGIFAVFQRVWRTGQPEFFPSAIYRDERDPGTWRENWVYKLASGEVIAIYHDITERKQGESQREAALAALRESEERYRALVENASDIVFRTDNTGHFTFLNRAALTTSGYEEGELIGKLYTIVIRPDMRVKALKFYGRQLGKGIHNTYFEIPIITKDGREVWLGQNSQLIAEDGQVTGFQAVSRDITKSKQAESQREAALAAMRESEEKYRILVEKANEAIIIVQDGVFVFANRSMSDLLGVPTGDLEGKPFIDFVWSEDRELVNANYRKRIAGEPVRDDYDFRIIGAGGRLTWVFLSAAVIQWKGKTATLNLLTDITERKRAEEVLQQYNQKWEAITTSSPDGIGMISLDGKLQLMSDKLLTMYGYSVKEKDEVINKIVFDFIDPSNHKMLFDNMRKLLAGKKDFNVSEYLAIKKDNSKFYVELSSSVLFDSKGDPESILFVERDITERKQAESQRETTLAALRESEENYRLLVENSRDIIYTLNTDGVFTFVSPAWTTLLGHSVNQVVGQPFQQFVHPDDLAGCMTLLQKVIETGQRQDGVDSYRVRHADGSWRWHITNAVPIKDAAGTVIGGEGIARDITERKQAEEEIKQQLAEKGILLKEVHHRIKNNIASIGGLISLHLQSITNPEAVAVLQDASSRVNSMRLLYDKLLLSEDYKDISVKNYLNELIATIIALFPDHAKIKFEKRIADFQLDPKRLFPLGSIINELLTNIMKHAFINGDAGSIKISLTNVGGHVKLTIQDNGIGLPEGFDIDKTKGFGLMLVKMLSQQLDGNFSIEKHAGTRCKVEFKI